MTSTATFRSAAQPVFCGMVIVRRHFGRRYRKHCGVVDHGDTISLIRVSGPKGDEGFVMPLLPDSPTGEKPFRNAAKHAGYIGRRIGNARTPAPGYAPDGPQW